MLDLNIILKNDSSPQSTAEALKEFWDRALFHPWQEVSSRPCKAIRSRFVELGWRLAGAPILNAEKTLAQIGEIIETLHLGSLIIDDIQDNSAERRGSPSLHHMYGMPLALNLGNFFYFQAMSLVSTLDVSSEFKNQAMKHITQTLRDAHLGQALDISVKIDEVARATIPKLVETSMRLKSGALMRLSIHLGALLNPEFANWQALDEFGESYGSCLQKFDDIGNFNTEGQSKKHLEDLMLRRPTWIWSVFAQEATEQEWLSFHQAVRTLPDKQKLAHFIASTSLKKTAFDRACADLKQTLDTLQFHFDLDLSDSSYQFALQLTEKLTHAY
jgi:geranylgeranyl pyrophosphate synthase